MTASGDFTMVKFHDETMVAYSLPGARSENLNNTIAYFIQEVLGRGEKFFHWVLTGGGTRYPAEPNLRRDR